MASTMKVKVSVVSNSLGPHGLYNPWNSPGQNTGAGSLFLLQGIFPTQESNQGLLHCMQILYQLSYEGSPASTMLSVNLWLTGWSPLNGISVLIKQTPPSFLALFTL